MLTVKLWRILIRPSKQGVIRRVIAPDVRQFRFRNGVRVASFIGFFVWIFLPFIFPVLLINFLCIQLTLKIAHAVARQHELGQHDLLAITPVGIFPFVIEICRAYLHFTHQEINRLLRSNLAPVLLTLGIICTGPVTMGIIFTSRSQGFLLTLLAFLTATLLVSFWEYIQVATLAVLLGILAGSTNRSMASSWAIGLLCTIQVSVYAGWFWLVSSNVREPVTIFLVMLLFAPFVFILREVVIYIVWRMLRRRFQDDLQTGFAG
jgi:hypothetical protein